jgi:glycosyltransferase involved in cell wall biosynthesis
MNILIISHLYYPTIGGVQVATSNLIKQYLKKGHRVELITTRWPKTLPKSEYINEVKVTRLPFRLPSYNPISFLKFIVRAIECIISLFFIVWREKFDLIHLRYVCENAPYAMMLSNIMHIPLVTSIHGSDIQYFALKRRLNRWVVRQCLKRSSQVIANSSALLEVALNMFGEENLKNPIVISNGVDISKNDLSKQAFSSQSPFLLGIGRLEHFKGFDVLIKALAIVKKKHPSIKLILIGDGIERGKLEQLRQRLGLDESVLFYGGMEHKDVLKMLSTCVFLVMPSRREAFGTVLIEAMAAKKAVIAMDVGGVPEIVQDRKNGLLVKNHSSKALADSMVYLLENPEFASDLGKNGRKLVESRYTWEIIADRYLKIYQSTL